VRHQALRETFYRRELLNHLLELFVVPLEFAQIEKSVHFVGLVNNQVGNRRSLGHFLKANLLVDFVIESHQACKVIHV